MKFLDEYRDATLARALSRQIHAETRGNWTLMEICGGQTHTIMKSGLSALLPPGIALVHGPGCPVCVTPVSLIDAAVELALRPGVILASFGDMLRVPGTGRSLLDARATGADVRIVYSPLDALKLARLNPSHQVIFFAVGFETTAPGNAMAIWQARQTGLANFSALVAHVLVPPAIDGILAAEGNRVQGFLAPGHVCSVEGEAPYEILADRWKVPIVVTGFEPVDLLEGILRCVRQLEAGHHRVENQYARAVPATGNPQARRIVQEVFETADREWRGLGRIPQGGLRLREPFHSFDALRRFGVELQGSGESGECQSGLVLLGRIKPTECPAFGRRCTPERPLGAPMVSSEGACAAYYRYGQTPAEA